MWQWALASARCSLTSTSIGEEKRESAVRVLRGETDAMGLGRGIFVAVIQQTKESSDASGGGGVYGFEEGARGIWNCKMIGRV